MIRLAIEIDTDVILRLIFLIGLRSMIFFCENCKGINLVFWHTLFTTIPNNNLFLQFFVDCILRIKEVNKISVQLCYTEILFCFFTALRKSNMDQKVQSIYVIQMKVDIHSIFGLKSPLEFLGVFLEFIRVSRSYSMFLGFHQGSIDFQESF